MSITLELKPEVERRLRARAEREGMDVKTLLEREIESLAGPEPRPFYETATPEERAQVFREWASRRRSDAPPLPDEAVSRDAIYGGGSAATPDEWIAALYDWASSHRGGESTPSDEAISRDAIYNGRGLVSPAEDLAGEPD